MQATSSGWAVAQAASYRLISDGFLLSPARVTASGVTFFTINTSTIGGPDIIKSGGLQISFFDKYRFDPYSDFLKRWPRFRLRSASNC